MSFLAACLQMTSRADVPDNLAKVRRGVEEAARRGAQMVVLPENFAFMGSHEDEKHAFSESLDAPGPIITAVLESAQKHKVWVVGGGFPEKTSDPKKVYNTCLVANPDGRVAGLYRKIHLFDVAIPGAAEFRESRTVEPGAEVVVVETPFGGLGLSICYDVRFPELYRALAVKGARIVVVPAAFTLHTGKDHWHPLLRARAIEDQVYVLAAAQYGKANEKRICYGHSLIVDPWGVVVAESGDREGVIVAELDAELQDKVRRELPALQHRRL
jgi:predicted amidohydrolase